MEHKQELFLAGVEHVISIRVVGERPCNYWGYKPESKYTIREGFWRKKVTRTRPAHYRGEYTSFVELDKLEHDILHHSAGSGDRYLIKEPETKNGHKTVVYKPMVHITLSGGKYTGSHTMYFDTYEKAKSYVTELNDKHKNKFVILEEK